MKLISMKNRTGNEDMADVIQTRETRLSRSWRARHKACNLRYSRVDDYEMYKAIAFLLKLDLKQVLHSETDALLR